MSQSDQPPAPTPCSELPDIAIQAGEEPRDAARLERDILEFAQRLKREHSHEYRHDRKGFTTRAVRYLKRALRPRRRRGAKRDLRVTKALTMKLKQLERRKSDPRARVRWFPIAFKCIPGFRDMTHSERRRRVRNLRNAVRGRSRREKAKIQKAGDAGRETNE